MQEYTLKFDNSEDNVIDFIKKYFDGKVDEEAVYRGLFDMVSYCKRLYYENSVLQKPKLHIYYMENSTGNYDSDNNIVGISKKSVIDVVKASKSDKNIFYLMDLIYTVGHEMRHYGQNSSSVEFDTLPKEQKDKITKEDKSIIKSMREYFRPSASDISELNMLVAPYFKGDVMPLGYKSKQDYYTDVQQSMYYSISCEKDARDAGYQFACDILKVMTKKYSDTFSEELLGKIFSRIENDAEAEYIYYIKAYKVASKFKLDYNFDTEEILKIVEDGESLYMKKHKDPALYKRLIRCLINGKTTKQKVELMKSAVYNGFDILFDEISELLKMQLNYKEIQPKISDILYESLLDNNHRRRKSKAICGGCSSMLSQNQYELLIGNEILNDNFDSARLLISYKDNFTCSLESILKYNKIYKCLDDLARDEYSDSAFWNALFSKLRMEEKIKLLRTGELNIVPQDILVMNIEHDFLYKPNKAIIDRLIYESYKKAYANAEKPIKNKNKFLQEYLDEINSARSGGSPSQPGNG